MGGAMILLLAAAEKKRRDQDAAARRARLRAEEKRRAEAQKAKSYGSSHYREGLNYFDCVAKEFLEEKNEVLISFFTKLNQGIQVVKSVEFEKQLEGYDKVKENYKKTNDALLEKQKKLEELGIELGGFNDFVVRDYYFDDNNNRKLDYEIIRTPYYKSFNGVILPLSVLEDPDSTYFEDVLKEKVEANSNMSEREKDIETRKKKVALREKFAFTEKAKSKLNDEQKNIQKEEEKIRQDKEIEELARKNLESYKAIANDPEKRNAIIEYLRALQEVNKVKDEMSDYSTKAYNLENNFYHSSKENKQKVFGEALDLLMENGEITEEELDKVYYQLDKIAIKAMRGRYAGGRNIYLSKNIYDECRESITWFVNDVYEADEKFVERSMGLLKETRDDE